MAYRKLINATPILLRAAQAALRDSGYNQREIGDKLKIPRQRVQEFMHAQNASLERTEAVLEAFAPETLDEARKMR